MEVLYPPDSECFFCLSHVSYLLPSLIDVEQCRQSMASMMLEGMHIVPMCLYKVFRDGLNGHTVLSANFTFLLAYNKYLDCFQWNSKDVIMSYLTCLIQKRNLSEKGPLSCYLYAFKRNISFLCICDDVVWSLQSVIAKQVQIVNLDPCVFNMFFFSRLFRII